MTDAEWRAFVARMALTPDLFMRWLLTPKGRHWFEHWRDMPIHRGWRQ